MSTFMNDTGALLWDATAVPNAFLCEYMPSAPEGHVKVYLYGLMCARAGMGEDDLMLDDAAKALCMEREAVERALRYWERCRLVERVRDNPPAYRYRSVQQMMLMKQSAPPDEAYERFAQALYALFGDKRKLHGGDSVLAYEWVEQLKLPPEVVLMLIRHMISTRGVQFSFKEAQKVATELSEQGDVSLETAEAVLSRSEAAWKGARKVLNRLGKRRSPSMDEIDLYVKWTSEWGYAPKAVEAACAETTKGDPSFAYLDGILLGIRERSGGKAVTPQTVEKQLSGEKDEGARVRDMLAAFGIKAPAVDEGKRLIYRDMRRLADDEVVLLAAREVGKRRGAHSLDDVQALLVSWKDRGLGNADEVSAYLRSVAEADKRLKALFTLAGKDASCTQQNRELLRKWREDWRVSDPLLELAATYAAGVDKPMAYMDKLLTGWQEQNVATVAEAQREHQRFSEAVSKARADSGQTGSKRVIEQQYEQRAYDPAEVDGPSAEDIEEAKKL